MYPEICHIGSFTVYSYGLMLVLAFITGSRLAAMEAGRQGINPDLILNLVWTAFLCGIIGARIFYVVEHFRFYLKDPLRIIMLQEGGLSWFGGLILGMFAAVIYLKRKRERIYKILDLIVPFLALAQAIGRIGCLLNGCCFGWPSEHGLYFPVHGQTLIPAQAYAVILLLVIFIVLRLLQVRPHKEGEIFFAYLFFYSSQRFLIEFLRADNPRVFSGLTLFQFLSIGIFFIALCKLFLISKPERQWKSI